uniref:Uncharacterized protein n=1 Tax=Oryza glumipatula TaxID=40148 RepID=A0A0E0AG26_9ORYZ
MCRRDRIKYMVVRDNKTVHASNGADSMSPYTHETYGYPLSTHFDFFTMNNKLKRRPLFDHFESLPRCKAGQFGT